MLSRIRFYSVSTFLLILTISIQIHSNEALQSTIRNTASVGGGVGVVGKQQQQQQQQRSFSTSTTIFYRDNKEVSYLNDDTTTTFSNQNQKLQQLQEEDEEELTNASAITTTLSSSPVPASTINNHIQEQVQESKSKWLIWPSTIIRMQGRSNGDNSSSDPIHDAKSTGSSKEQSEVDAYLTFLDRRYQ